MLLRLIFPHLLGAWLLLSLFPADSSTQIVDDPPMQLCGRDFIRAVIFICGGSRWKRYGKTEKQPDSARGQWFVSRESDEENEILDRKFLPPLKEEQSTLLNQDWELLNNMLLSHGGTEDLSITMKELPRGFDELKEAIEKKRIDIRATNPLKQHDFIMGTYSRKKRQATLGIADRCCHISCTKSDIALLC